MGMDMEVDREIGRGRTHAERYRWRSTKRCRLAQLGQGYWSLFCTFPGGV